MTINQLQPTFIIFFSDNIIVVRQIKKAAIMEKALLLSDCLEVKIPSKKMPKRLPAVNPFILKASQSIPSMFCHIKAVSPNIIPKNNIEILDNLKSFASSFSPLKGLYMSVIKEDVKELKGESMLARTTAARKIPLNPAVKKLRAK